MAAVSEIEDAIRDSLDYLRSLGEKVITTPERVQEISNQLAPLKPGEGSFDVEGVERNFAAEFGDELSPNKPKIDPSQYKSPIKSPPEYGESAEFASPTVLVEGDDFTQTIKTPVKPEGFSRANIIELYKQETDASDLNITKKDLYYFIGYKLMRFISSYDEIQTQEPGAKSVYVKSLIKYRGDTSIDDLYDDLIPMLIDMNADACNIIFDTLLRWEVHAPVDVTLYRGLSSPKSPYDQYCFDLIRNCKENQEISFPSFMSTSTDPNVATRFAGSDDGIILVITLPKGQRFTYISDESSSESEVLLNAHCNLRFLHKDGNQYHFTYSPPAVSVGVYADRIRKNVEAIKGIYERRRSSRLAGLAAEEKGGKRSQTKRKPKTKRTKRKKESKRKPHRYYGKTRRN
jgi:hypothetical protein